MRMRIILFSGPEDHFSWTIQKDFWRLFWKYFLSSKNIGHFFWQKFWSKNNSMKNNFWWLPSFHFFLFEVKSEPLQRNLENKFLNETLFGNFFWKKFRKKNSLQNSQNWCNSSFKRVMERKVSIQKNWKLEMRILYKRKFASSRFFSVRNLDP